MMTLIGPVLFRQGNYAFDIFSAVNGMRRSFEYRRVEDAIYDRNMTMQNPKIMACDTCAEFVAECRDASYTMSVAA